MALRVKWFLKKAGVCLLILLVIVVLLLLSGMPQEKLVTYALKKALNKDLRVEHVSLLGAVRISEISTRETPPTARLSKVVLDYDVRPGDSGYIRSLGVDELRLLAGNWQLKAGIEAAPRLGGPGPRRLIPSDWTIRLLEPSLTGRGFQLALDGLTAEYTGAGGANQLLIAQSPASISITMGDLAEHRFDGRVDINVTNTRGEITLAPRILFPGLADIEAKFALADAPEGKVLEVSIPVLDAQGIEFPIASGPESKAQLRFYSVRLKEVRAERARLRLAVNPRNKFISTKGTDLAIRMSGEGPGWKDQELLRGNLSCILSDGGEAAVDLRGTLQLNELSPVNLSVKGSLLKLAANMLLQDWTRDQLLASAGNGLLGRLSRTEVTSLERVEAHADFDFPQVGATAAADIQLNSAETMHITAATRFSIADFLLGEDVPISMSATLGDQWLKCALNWGRGRGPQFHLLFDNLSLRKWATGMLGYQVPLGIDGRCSGSVHLAGTKGDGPRGADLFLSVPEGAFGPFQLQDFQASGSLNMSWSYLSDGLVRFHAKRARFAQLEIDNLSGSTDTRLISITGGDAAAGRLTGTIEIGHAGSNESVDVDLEIHGADLRGIPLVPALAGIGITGAADLHISGHMAYPDYIDFAIGFVPSGFLAVDSDKFRTFLNANGQDATFINASAGPVPIENLALTFKDTKDGVAKACTFTCNGTPIQLTVPDNLFAYQTDIH